MPGCNSTVGRPLGSDFQYPFGLGQLPEVVRPLNAFLNSQVQVRQHIGPPQPEHHEHLCSPAPDAFNLRKCRDNLVVGQLMERLDWKLSRCDTRTQILEVSRLLSR